MKRKVFVHSVLIWLSVGSIGLLSGCAAPKEPTLGERMLMQSDAARKLSRQWQTGEERVRSGEKLVKEGESLINEAQADLRKGEDKVKKGHALIEQGQGQMAESERVYRVSFPEQ